tara:strand:+ start:278 stop:694 length:417 start_codon:yes stop_codon:yes gene_type:complete
MQKEGFHMISSARSKNMSAIKSKNTKPEIEVRKLLHSMGFRFRLHRKDLPGSPDIFLPKFKTVIFVHGCFWHRHENCKYSSTPKTRVQFWEKKFNSNILRDLENQKKIKDIGLRSIIIWECELKNKKELEKKLFDIRK